MADADFDLLDLADAAIATDNISTMKTIATQLFNNKQESPALFIIDEIIERGGYSDATQILLCQLDASATPSPPLMHSAIRLAFTAVATKHFMMAKTLCCAVLSTTNEDSNEHSYAQQIYETAVTGEPCRLTQPLPSWLKSSVKVAGKAADRAPA